MQHFLSRKLTAIIFLGAILLYFPTWLWLAEAWWSDPYYSHGPLVIIISAYLIWARRGALATEPLPHPPPAQRKARSSRNEQTSLGQSVDIYEEMRAVGSLLLIILSLAVHLWATWWRAYYISALTIPVLLFGLLTVLYGFSVSRSFAFPLGFLFLMVPLPLAERFGPMLEAFTASNATQLAQFVGVAATNNGSQVFLPNSAFTVGIPCGGLSSAIAIITLTTLFAYIVHGSILARAAIFLAAIPIALAANMLRLSLLFAIAQRWGEQVGMDYFHSWSSPVLFVFAFVLLVALAYLLRCASVRWDVLLPA